VKSNHIYLTGLLFLWFRYQGVVWGNHNWCTQSLQDDEGWQTQGSSYQCQWLCHKGQFIEWFTV